MTAREAKRLACEETAEILDGLMSNGWPDCEVYDFSEADRKRYVGAVKELCKELERRGGARKAGE